MGAYFRVYKKEGLIRKTLIRKKGGSPYPSIHEFEKRLFFIKKYMGDFVVKTTVVYDGYSIRLEQPFIDGRDFFKFIKENEKPKNFFQFVQKLKDLYLNTGMLVDLLNKENILVTKDNQIKIVDIWPLFFKKRVDIGDISKSSFEENIQKFNFLNSLR